MSIWPGSPPLPILIVSSRQQLIIANDVLRGGFRRIVERAEPIVPNKFAEYVIDLHHNDHVFLKGHKIMVPVQSTWSPVIDRNPQKFVPSIFQAPRF